MVSAKNLSDAEKERNYKHREPVEMETNYLQHPYPGQKTNVIVSTSFVIFDWKVPQNESRPTEPKPRIGMGLTGLTIKITNLCAMCVCGGTLSAIV